MAELITPPTREELALEKARDEARRRAEAEQAAAREQEETARRQRAGGSFSFDSYFTEHAERIRREWEERRRKSLERDRER